MKSGVMITGATRGIGRALVYAFAQRGFDVAFCSGNKEDCLALTEELKKQYPETVTSEKFVTLRMKHRSKAL